MTPPELNRVIQSLRAKSSANYRLARWLVLLATDTMHSLVSNFFFRCRDPRS